MELSSKPKKKCECSSEHKQGLLQLWFSSSGFMIFYSQFLAMEKRASSCAEAEFALQTWVEDTEPAV